MQSHFNVPKPVEGYWDISLLLAVSIVNTASAQELEEFSIPVLKGLKYDPVPILPGFGAFPMGRNFLISSDETGAVFLGQDRIPEKYIFGPYSQEAHFLNDDVFNPKIGDVGYQTHLEPIYNYALINDPNSTTIRTTGFALGSSCNYDLECESGNCDIAHVCVA